MAPLRLRLIEAKRKDVPEVPSPVPLMSEEQQSRIFSNVQVILNVHTALLAELEAKYQAWPDKQLTIGATLISIVCIVAISSSSTRALSPFVSLELTDLAGQHTLCIGALFEDLRSIRN